MTIDPKIKDAIMEAVKEEQQSESLAYKLIAWFDAIASGGEDINDPQDAYRHLELLYEEVQLSREGEESEQ